jgi:hypothetical protein
VSVFFINSPDGAASPPQLAMPTADTIAATIARGL